MKVVLTDEERQELDRRLVEHEQNPSSAQPREKVRGRLRERFGA